MTQGEVTLRPLTELDLEAISAIDEKIVGRYRPEVWEGRVPYYLRRDPELPLVAELDGKVVGFMLGEVRAGDFGLEEPSGWIEVLGVDPEVQGQSIGRRLLAGILEGFRARGAAVVRTLVDSKEQAHLIGFFEASGFEVTQIRTLARSLKT